MSEWPSPSFERAGANYECAACGAVVDPADGDKECALQIAGRTERLCESCAEDLEDVIQDD